MRATRRGRSSRWLGALLVLGATYDARTLATAADLALPGPFFAGQTVVTVDRPGGGSFNAELYYPATAPGTATPLAPGGLLPAVTFGHGFLQDPQDYNSTLQHLATHGYLVIATQSQTGFFVNHNEYAGDLRASLDYLVNQTASPGSWLFGRVNSGALGASGHSLGGGVSILVAAADPRIRAVANLAAANTLTDPSARDQMANLTIPINLIAASDDQYAPPDVQQQPMYDNGVAPKQITYLMGGSHCRFEDDDFFFLCDGSSLSRGEQLTFTRRELTTFFDFYLKRDQSLWRQVWGPELTADAQVVPQVDSGIRVIPDLASRQGLPGQPLSYQVTVVNQGRGAASFELFSEDQTWPTLVSPPVTPVLAPGQSTTVTVQVTPPAAAFGAQDRLLLSARTSADGLTRGYTQLTSSTPAFAGELAVASLGNNAVWKFDAGGAGNLFADAGDGLLTPLATSYDAAGNLLVADALRSRVARFTPGGAGTIFADSADGLSSPSGLAVAEDGSLLVTNYLTNTIVRVDPSGQGTPFADAADGLASPFGAALDAQGNLYVASLGNRQVLKFDPAGNSSVFADAADGLLTPFGVALDAAGNVYVSDVLRSRITRFTPAGVGSVFADVADGLTSPAGLAFDAQGYLYAGNYLSNNIVRLDGAGNGVLFADGGDGLASPFGLATRFLLGGSGGAGATAVPEPTGVALLAAALPGLAWVAGHQRRRRR